MKALSEMEADYMDFMDYVEEEKEEAKAEGIKEGIKAGIEQGAENTKISNAKKMLEDGNLSLDKIAEYSGLSLEKVKEIAQEVKVTVSK